VDLAVPPDTPTGYYLLRLEGPGFLGAKRFVKVL